MSVASSSRSMLSSASALVSCRPCLPLRHFSSTPAFLAAPRSDAPRPGSDLSKPLTREQAFDIADIPTFMFDDTTSSGHMMMERRRESLELLRAVERDRELLQRQQKSFTPPSRSSPLRFTRTLYLTDLPTSTASSSSSNFGGLPPSQTVKRVLQVPVQGLVENGKLEGGEGVRRFKILAGARWTPDEKTDIRAVHDVAKSESGSSSSGEKSESTVSSSDSGERWADKGKHGWIKMSETAFPEGKMNRKWLSDALDRLIAEANNPSLPIPTSTPIDTRHVVSRLRKKGKLLPGGGRKPTGLEAFPKEWL